MGAAALASKTNVSVVCMYPSIPLAFQLVALAVFARSLDFIPSAHHSRVLACDVALFHRPITRAACASMAAAFAPKIALLDSSLLRTCLQVSDDNGALPFLH